MNRVELAASIDAVLPQTQCRQCGYAGCRPYADAIVDGRAEINQCAPGGDEGARELANLLKVPYAPVDSRFGVTKAPAVAVIDETICIGCTLCLEACPVDAIAGAAKLMHTVIASNCTGCELCLPPCPVDCISMRPAKRQATRDEQRTMAAMSKQRFERRTDRLSREEAEKRAHGRRIDTEIDVEIVRQAIERARQRLAKRR